MVRKKVLSLIALMGLAIPAFSAGETTNLGLKLWTTGETDYVETYNQNMANLDVAVVTNVTAVSTGAFATLEADVNRSTEINKSSITINTDQLVDVAVATTTLATASVTQTSADCQLQQPGAIGELCYDTTFKALFIGTSTLPGGFAAAGGDFTPVGTVVAYSTTTVPSGWLLADGASYNVIDQQELFDAIGYFYGGAGSVFNVPDLKTRFVAGRDPGGDTAFDVLGEVGGAKTHGHGDTGGVTSGSGNSGDGTGGSHPTQAQTHTHSINGAGNLPPYMVLVYIIKAETTAGASGASGGAGTPWITDSNGINFPGSVGISSETAPGFDFVIGSNSYLTVGSSGFKLGVNPVPALIVGSDQGVFISSFPVELGAINSILQVGSSFFTVAESGQSVFGDAEPSDPYDPGNDPLVLVAGDIAIGFDTPNGGALSLSNESGLGNSYKLFKGADGSLTIGDDDNSVSIVNISTPDYHVTLFSSMTATEVGVATVTTVSALFSGQLALGSDSDPIGNFLVPISTGAILYNTTLKEVCLSTGTLFSDWVRLSSATAVCQ